MQYLVTLSSSGFFVSSDASPQSWFSAATIFYFPLLQNSLQPSMHSSAERSPKILLMNSNAILMDCASPFIIPRHFAEYYAEYA